MAYVYQQQGSMPAQHAAPATQHDAANAAAEKVEAPIAATTFAYIDFMKLLQLVDVDLMKYIDQRSIWRLPRRDWKKSSPPEEGFSKH